MSRRYIVHEYYNSIHSRIIHTIILLIGHLATCNSNIIYSTRYRNGFVNKRGILKDVTCLQPIYITMVAFVNVSVDAFIGGSNSTLEVKLQ